MTEAEWLQCSDPLPMMEFLRGKSSTRKLTLFAVACCRRNWRFLTDERLQRAVEVAEKFADGLASAAEMEVAHDAAWAARNVAWEAHHQARSASLEIRSLAVDVAKAASDAAGVTRAHRSNYWDPPKIWTSPWTTEEYLPQCELLRCLLGRLPFHTVSIHAISEAERRVVAVRLAESIYADRTFDRLPILADALEEAGCTNADILGHCRGPGPHVRGCWVVDLLLGKQ